MQLWFDKVINIFSDVHSEPVPLLKKSSLFTVTDDFVNTGPHLAQRLELGLHDELVFAQLAAASVGALDPLLQTGLVDEAQAPRAVAWCDQRALIIPFAVTNPVGAREYSQR